MAARQDQLWWGLGEGGAEEWWQSGDETFGAVVGFASRLEYVLGLGTTIT
jgi:hypothetical protein